MSASIMKFYNSQVMVSIDREKLKARPTIGWKHLEHFKPMSTPLVNDWVQFPASYAVLSVCNGHVMLFIDHKVFDVITTAGCQRLVFNKLPVLYLKNKRLRFMASIVPIVACKYQKLVITDPKRFDIWYSCCGNFFEFLKEVKALSTLRFYKWMVKITELHAVKSLQVTGSHKYKT